MLRFSTLILLVVFALPSAAAAGGSGRTAPCPPEGNFKTLPSGIDMESANRLWCWMKREVNAPLDLAPPPVLVGPLAQDKYSVFVFPTRHMPDNVLSIEIAATMMRYEDPLFVLWALGHELAHALFTLRPFGFKEQATYPIILPAQHHCDPEFRQVTKGAADLIWSIFHSSQQRSRMLALHRQRYVRECGFFSNPTRLRRGS